MRYVVANWKMHFTRAEVLAFCEAALPQAQPSEAVTVAIAPPFPLLFPLAERLKGTGIQTLGQNAHQAAKGAFTGEVSMNQLADAGCGGVILGHSERRQQFHETEALLSEKIPAARAVGLVPLLCVGETLAQREAGETLSVLKEQLSILTKTGPGPLWVAYEPVWAIGTGRRAEAPQIAEAHAFIDAELSRHGHGGTPVLYGGSVTPETFGELLAIPFVAGGLVGGASMDPVKFASLVATAKG